MPEARSAKQILSAASLIFVLVASALGQRHGFIYRPLSEWIEPDRRVGSEIIFT